MTDTILRIERERRAGWVMPPGTSLVSRGTIFGNPWEAGAPGLINIPASAGGVVTQASYAFDHVLTVQDVVEAFRAWLDLGTAPVPPAAVEAIPDVAERLAARREIVLARISSLRGRHLCCWCELGTPCHADVLMEMANG